MLHNTLFFPTNGSGLGHMNRCLAYASQLRGRANASFFSLASAMEIIEQFGFEADYFVSHFWTRNGSYDWNCELALRLGMMFDRVKPTVVVFDGTWPFQGFLAACKSYGKAKLVWSSRGLFKEGVEAATVDNSIFDLIIRPGELGDIAGRSALQCGTQQWTVPPVTLLQDAELLDRATARKELGLQEHARHVLFSLGPGNLKDIKGIGNSLIQRFQAENYTIAWACSPISVQDVELPSSIVPISVYPLVRYLRAFDVFVGAAGYNTCCEVVQAQIPSLLVPNALLVDDQTRRAHLVAQHAPAVVSTCESPEEQCDAVKRVLQMVDRPPTPSCKLVMNGADLAAEAIFALAAEGGKR